MPHYDEARGLLSDISKQSATLVADDTHAATSKATPVDTDEVPLVDSAASFSLKKLTWANIKATLAAWIAGNLIPASFTSVTTSGTIQTDNAQYVKSKNATGVATRILGISVGNVVYVGSLDTTDVHTLVARLSGVDRVITDATGVIVFGDITTSGGAILHKTLSSLSNGAGVAAGTILNAPVAGNPTKWIGVNDNGTIRYIPSW